jgi:alkylated DNA repair protein (DNA oxidative demethylase)
MNTIRPRIHEKLNLIYEKDYVSGSDKKLILDYLSSLHPIWENRFSASNPPPNNESNRSLLRPVYWLGNWQFACLDYYHPPKGIHHRCVRGEKYPPVLQKIISDVEKKVRDQFSEKDIPRDWQLNTCLINYYGNKIDVKNNETVKTDMARVGEHKDFEPGPVASISFGEKAMFQFVKSSGKSQKSNVVLQQWLDDSSLQIFGGDKFKKQLFHRVQRVENKGLIFKNTNTTNFETRRINFTFRYVPYDHIQTYNQLPAHLQTDISGYIAQLGTHSKYWKEQIS